MHDAEWTLATAELPPNGAPTLPKGVSITLGIFWEQMLDGKEGDVMVEDRGCHVV